MLRKGYPLEEDPLIAFTREVGDSQVRIGGDGRAYLRHVGRDDLPIQRPGHRDPVMAVADEVQLADAKEVDRRERLSAAGSSRQPLEAFPWHAARRPEM